MDHFSFIMDLTPFTTFTDTHLWGAIVPEIILLLGALLVLSGDLLSPRSTAPLLARTAIGVMAITFLGIVFNLWGQPLIGQDLFAGMIEQSELTTVYRLFFLLCGLLVCGVAMVYFGKQSLARVEYFALVMILTASLMILVQSSHLIMMFVALETVTVGFYVMVSYARTSAYSLEAGLKYLILGALSSSLLLAGIVLVYGTVGNPNLEGFAKDGFSYEAINQFLTLHPDALTAKVGALLILSGILFKVGAVPFQIWIPDVYQGAPTPTMAFLAVASKAAGIFLLVSLFTGVGPFAPLSGFIAPLLVAITVVTILFGNLTALGQQNVKRILGLSGVAHAGYLLIGVITLLSAEAPIWTISAILLYLFVYMLASFAVVGVMIHLSDGQDANQELCHFANLSKAQPFLAGILAIGLGSLAGIPPLAGFIGKLLLFVAAFKAGLYGVLGVAIVGVVISIYYYFGWVREAYFRGTFSENSYAEKPWVRITSAQKIVLLSLAIISIILGFVQGSVGNAFTLSDKQSPDSALVAEE